MTTHKEALTRITRDDTEHGKEYYLASDVDALLAQPEQEPVAWMYPDALCDRSCLYVCTKAFTQLPECATTPPQRTWVGLTPKEELDAESVQIHGIEAVIKWVEAKLKEKNT